MNAPKSLHKSITQQVSQIRQDFLNELKVVRNYDGLETIRITYLGRKQGKITALFSKLPTLGIADRKKIGPLLNELKAWMNHSIESHGKTITQKPSRDSSFDPTIPGQKILTGHLHPITKERYRVEDIFQRMGFDIVLPREVYDEFHVFEALNIPSEHPARDLWDTFWTEDHFIPITHTSAMQHDILSTQKPPIRAIVPGRCFRHEATDARHEHTFYQIEGICVDRGITLTDLVGTLSAFFERYFEKPIKTKVQPSYFPFVEPGLEFLVECVICHGKGCSTCGHSGWLELVPCGPIHPKVLSLAGINPKTYSGFAWGMGLDRLTMLRYGIEDIRHFHSGDLRFLEQF